MPIQTTKYKIFISSPSDVVKELEVISEVIDDWNITNSDNYGATLEQVSWKTHATSEMGDRPQAIINKQLELKKCDILIAIFWTRLGTPTGKAKSGSVEEIEEFLRDGKPVSLYFSSIPIALTSINMEQLQRLRDLKNKYKENGIIVDYESIDSFQRKFRMDITRKINSIHNVPIKINNGSGINQRTQRKSILKKLTETGRLEPVVIQVASGTIVSGGSGGAGHLTALQTVYPRVFDERKQPPIGTPQLPFYTWNPQNFDGFFYDLKDDLGKESLHVIQPNLGANQRTIGKDKLIYTTAAELKKLKVVEDAFDHNAAYAAMAGLERVGTAFTANGEYSIIGWQGEKYVALNGKIDKLSKLIVEHGTSASEKKTLSVGETWDIGDGWTLTANAIDAKALPRQVWLTLSKNGVKKDDKVIGLGSIYTYVEKSLAGETDVPLFVTYVNSVFAGATTDMVSLRYTWVVSTSVTHIRSSDTYGVFKNANVSGKTISLYNSDIEIILSQNALVDLMGNLKFKVADRADVLRFFPIIYNNRRPNSC